MQTSNFHHSHVSRLSRVRRLPPVTVLLLAGLAAGGLQAQSTGATPPTTDRRDQHYNSATGSGYGSETSWIPYTRRGYVGLSAGRAKYTNSCGTVTGLSCDSSNTSVHVFTGGMFNDNFGIELGYKAMGKADRAGGTTRAEGVNLSLVASLPFESVNLYAKGGATYGRTRVSTAAGSGAPSGRDSGWGPSAAIGIGYNFDRNWALSLERSRDSFHFAGQGRAHVDSTNLAVRYHF